ncbi:MAG TPA: DivIVA domain-containing protein, partial [Mycobacteriales bacterium]|nr:DivIVA domain-containing protein [Mycobacteriales bacterium]
MGWIKIADVVFGAMTFGQAGQQGARRPEQRIGAADVRAVRFGKPPFGRRGYDETEVDEFLRQVADALAHMAGTARMDPERVHEVAFRKPRIGSRGYDEDEVDAFLDLVEAELRWRGTPEGQRDVSAELAGSGPRAVRAVAVAVLVERGRVLVAELPDPVSGRTVYRPPGGEVAFRKPRIGSRGYDEDEVDAFLDLVEAELRWRGTPEGQRDV